MNVLGNGIIFVKHTERDKQKVTTTISHNMLRIYIPFKLILDSRNTIILKIDQELHVPQLPNHTNSD